VGAGLSKRLHRAIGKEPARMNTLKVLLCDEGAQGLVEYALIISLIAVVCFAALQLFGKKTSNEMGNDANSINNAM
jgi:Flp pilus assembly pilin Flp